MKTKEKRPLPEQVSGFIREKQLVDHGQKLVVAVSGGADSVCLLHVLDKLRGELALKLHVAHLNHQLRGADADTDARYVSDLARTMNLPATIEKADVPAYQRQHRLSPEEAAREVRYAFLARVVLVTGADGVAVGHTLNDHVETILMHLIRGSGTRGLIGLHPKIRQNIDGEKLNIIRPLLEISREETDAYCRQQQLEPRLDTSNLLLSPLRNRIRLELLPLLQNYNPNIVATLQRTARTIADEYNLIEEEGKRFKGSRKIADAVILDKAEFQKLHPALQRYLLRQSIEKLIGNLKDIEADHIEDIMDALEKPAGKRIALPCGLSFSIEYDRYLVGTDPAVLAPFPELETEFELNIPGTTSFPGGQIEASIIDHPEIETKEDDFTASFDLAKTDSKIFLRGQHSGDRFQPLGMSQEKKLNRFMIDSKIPQSWRRRTPIVTTPEQIIWVVGYRIDDKVKVTADTAQILCLKFKRI
ncbi:tRNA lysidine(34) synthetase TilS [Chloroflexota bacterium]